MSYTGQDIELLEGIDHVRRRPGMYIGGTDAVGYHHLLWEIVDNAVDEAMNGHALQIEVTLLPSGKEAIVRDDGRGIPVDVHPQTGKSALEVILSNLFSGAKFDNKQYAASGGLHGVGSAVVNALSTSMVATITRDGAVWQQSFAQGRPTGSLIRLRDMESQDTRGTEIRFAPDPSIFGAAAQFDSKVVAEHLEISTFLNPGLKLVLNDQMQNSRVEFHHEGGVSDFLKKLIKDAEARGIHGDTGGFVLRRDADPRLDVALGWTDATTERWSSYVNGIPTKQGGTHEQGVRDAVVRAIKDWFGHHEAVVPRGVKISTEDIREGIIGVCSIFIAVPQFQGQTKERLNNPEVKGQVEAIVRPAFERWLLDNPSQADAIAARVILAARARLASREATNQVRRKSDVSRRLNLPGKLSDCSSADAKRSELFLVEGDSAGGSAKQARDREFQAILPLRGKVLNTESASMDKIKGNKELDDIVKALGCGIGKDLNLDRLRYGKIILLMDADSDGHHIATLLLTFLYRHLAPLVDNGHVYVAQPPLFRIEAGKKTWWAADERERDAVLANLPARSKPEISRFKGLGEMMPQTLYETTMDPARRRMAQVVVPPGARVATDQVLNDLMGKDPRTRFAAITQYMDTIGDLDV